MPTSRLIETTSFVASLVPTNPRMITPLEQHAEQPARGRTRTTTSATGAGQPQSKRSCQYVNAASIPAAPWAKLKMPVVV